MYNKIHCGHSITAKMCITPPTALDGNASQAEKAKTQNTVY